MTDKDLGLVFLLKNDMLEVRIKAAQILSQIYDATVQVRIFSTIVDYC